MSKLISPFMLLPIYTTLVQFIRYSTIGIIINLFGYFIYIILTFFDIEPKASMTFVYILGVASSLLANRKWTFMNEENLSKIMLRSLVVYCVGYFIDFLLLYFFVGIRGYPHQMIQAIAVVIVAFFIFVAFKWFVFKTEAIMEDK